MREKLETLTLASLRELAKQNGIKSVTTMKKSEIIDALLRMDEQRKAPAPAPAAEVATAVWADPAADGLALETTAEAAALAAAVAAERAADLQRIKPASRNHQ